MKLLKLLLITIIVLSLPTYATSITVEKWEVIDVHHQSTEQLKSPFTTNVIATAIHSSGKRQIVPMVFDGNSNWLLRFSAGELGKWHYEITSSVKSLSGQKGEITVVENDDASNHGAMVISKTNPQTFEYEDGSPYFLLGYELDWLFALDYDNNDGLPKSEHMLSLLKDNGFNHIVMNVYAHDVSWHKDPKLAQHPEHEFGGKQNIFPFLGSNENPDFSALNVEFFKKFDRTISMLHDKRIVSHLMIYVWNKMVHWPDMNSDADNMYFDYVVKRYSAYPNIVWDISKEALYYGRADEAYIKGRIERLRAINYFDRLVTVHDYKYCSKYPEQVDFISTQDWKHAIYHSMLNVRKRFKEKPIFNIEHGGYEESPYLVFPGDYTNAEVALRRNWLVQFAGVYSTYYWQGSSWNVIIYNPFEQPKDFIKPRFDYFKHMAALFKEYDFSTFKPNPGKNGSGYTISNGKETYLSYAPKENYQMSGVNWYLKKNLEDGDKSKGIIPRTYRWFNTLTGEFTEEKSVERSTRFVSPWRGEADAILISELVK